ncbi:hypothetical protein DL98DRAFT_534072 [Cadophora sp. DSE1049]|nr:hypothetical protein DL98DRAFT_534072 [Cadophora sp. DSE1049]
MSFHDVFVPLWAPIHQGSTLLRALDRILDWIAAAEQQQITNKAARFADVIKRAITTGDFTDMECSICKDPIVQVSTKQYWWKEDNMGIETYCSHKFHGRCLWAWIQDSNRRNCPYCRTPFNFTKKPWEVPLQKYCGVLRQHMEPRLNHEQFLFRLAFMKELEIHPSELLYHLLEIHLRLRDWQLFAVNPEAFRQCIIRAEIFTSKTKAALNIPSDTAPDSHRNFSVKEIFQYGEFAAGMAMASSDTLNELNAVVSHKNFEEYVQRFVEGGDDLVRILVKDQPESSDLRSFIQHQTWNSPTYRIVARSPKVEYGPFNHEEAFAKISKLLRWIHFVPSIRKMKNREAFKRLEQQMQLLKNLADRVNRMSSQETGEKWLKALCEKWTKPKSAPPKFWSIFEGEESDNVHVMFTSDDRNIDSGPSYEDYWYEANRLTYR